ncbi:MAG TPA: ABC transporter permease [Candidatus Blautia gallistercoris]|uniref:Transport permease protein n=1 Tax=Candidatus Blautia gallistercoris TaxID=2838490 RepID=A0A9D1WI74_9FIRM|nr:ABC transporter permease [Candidatus Blautia gallistercoris]
MRFVNDLKKYWKYTKYAAKSELKSEVASSYLNWLWWILDPLLFMLVYTFIAMVVFRKSVQYFPVFVFIGLTSWNFFNKTVIGSVKLVKANKQIVTKVYLPKFVLVLQKLLVNGFKMMISFILVLIMMVIYRVPVTWNILFMIPLLMVLVILTFGVSNIMMHFGVFVDDLFNVMTVLLRLTFYMSGIFYSISQTVPEPYQTILLKCNPMAFIMDSMRNCMLYSTTPEIWLILIWGAVGVLLTVIAIRVVYKYENSYVKVI